MTKPGMPAFLHKGTQATIPPVSLPERQGNPLDALLPTDPLMRWPWASCLRVVARDPEALAAFRRDTGCTWKPGHTSLDRMIDEATGAERDWLVQFITWFNANVWGPLNLTAGAPHA